MYTGNLIGKKRILYQGNAGGIWNQQESYNATQEKIWPTNGLYVIAQGYVNAVTITQPVETRSGDLLLIYNYASNQVSATIPTAVTPSGYTNIFNVGRSTATIGQRITGYYKIADGTEGGVSVTGMDSTADYLVIYLVRWNKAITTVTPTDVETDNTFTATVTKTVATGGSIAPAILFHAHRSFNNVVYYYSDGTYELPNYGIFDVRNNATLNTYYNNPSTNPNISYATSGMMGTIFYGLKLFNYPTTPDINITVKGDGTFNIMATGYLQIS